MRIQLILATLLPYSAALAGVNGQWAAATPSGPAAVVLELKAEGTRLTGWLAQPDRKLVIANGSIEGDAVYFEMAVTIEGRPLTLAYSGRLEGDELRLTLRPKDLPGEERVVFKRVAGDRFSEPAAPDEVTAWIKAHALRMDDLAPLRDRLKDARIVAMGEATHGTREFQQLKVQMFRFLVENLGFTVFGIEANWPESLAVNDYVQGANVDPSRGLGFLWWHTEEVFGLLRWMREYNQDPAHTRKLKFYGFDMQAPELAESNVLAYLRRVDPPGADAAREVFIKYRTAERLEAFLRQFDQRKSEWVRRSSEPDWTVARQNLNIVRQAEVKLGYPDERGRAFRDRAMAENVQWILDQEPPGTRMMLWAHNGHAAAAPSLDSPDRMPMGGHLRNAFGDRLVSCGFAFEQGSFRAVDLSASGVRAFTVGPPPRGSLDATLAASGIPRFAIDLRGIREPKVADWFAAPHVSRQIGAGYSEATPGVWMQRLHAARQFDLLLFVDRTTPSR